jgi:hypothetical protein
MLDNTKDVQGVGVYAEFRKPGATMQVIITPDGYTTDGKEVPANLFRRVVTPASPKKQWRNSPIPNQGITELGGVQLADDKKEAFASQRLFFAINLLDSVNDGNWQIVKDAFVIEVSKKDLEDIRTSKTPNKLLYRIGLVREANEFPTELIEA